MKQHVSQLPDVQHAPTPAILVGAGGGVQVNIQLHRLPVPSQDVWVWHLSTETIRTLEEDDLVALQEEGWDLVDQHNVPFPFLALLSQLADTIPVLEAMTSKIKTLAKVSAIAAAEQFPVILAFTYRQQPEQLPVLPGPPAQLGELGLILEGNNQVFTYHIALLGALGKELGQQLRTALAMFLSSSVQGSEREQAWLDAQVAARKLAELYWELHQQAMLTDTESDEPQQVVTKQGRELVAPSGVKRSRMKLPPATTILDNNPPGITITADEMTQTLMQALLDGEGYKPFPHLGIAEHKTARPDIRITIRPGSGEEWDSVLNTLKMLGDEVLDTFCALIAIAIDVNQGNLTEPFFLDVDDILKVCERKQSHRSYTPLQRLHVVEHLRSLARVHITAQAQAQEPSTSIATSTRRSRRHRQVATDGGTFLRIDSPVLDLLGTVIGEYLTLTGETLWERREVKIGRWVTLAPSLSRQTAIMLRKVLSYHARRQRHEKRIGRWLTLQFQVQTGQHAGAIICNTRTLLEQSGIKPNLNNPGEMSESLLDAIEQLMADNIISGFQQWIVPVETRSSATSIRYFEGGSSPSQRENERSAIGATNDQAQAIKQLIEQRARGWWALYEKHLWWRFSPPHILVSQDRWLPAHHT
jgi:hypothetical protein